MIYHIEYFVKQHYDTTKWSKYFVKQCNAIMLLFIVANTYYYS